MTDNNRSEDLSNNDAPIYQEEDKAVISLLKTVDYINRISSDTMEPFGITSQQYNILRILRGAAPDGLPTLELADRMLVRSPGVTRLIDRLAKKQLVSRERSEKDRRVVLCKITDKGKELLEEMDETVGNMNKKIVRNLDNQQLEQLTELLDLMRG